MARSSTACARSPNTGGSGHRRTDGSRPTTSARPSGRALWLVPFNTGWHLAHHVDAHSSMVRASTSLAPFQCNSRNAPAPLDRVVLAVVRRVVRQIDGSSRAARANSDEPFQELGAAAVVLRPVVQGFSTSFPTLGKRPRLNSHQILQPVRTMKSLVTFGRGPCTPSGRRARAGGFRTWVSVASGLKSWSAALGPGAAPAPPCRTGRRSPRPWRPATAAASRGPRRPGG